METLVFSPQSVPDLVVHLPDLVVSNQLIMLKGVGVMHYLPAREPFITPISITLFESHSLQLQKKSAQNSHCPKPQLVLMWPC